MATSGPENRFIARVHRRLSPDIYHLKNHNVYAGGLADCWYSGKAGDLWVEYKWLHLPLHNGSALRLGLTALQDDWLSQRHAEGRRVAVIAGSAEGCLIADHPSIWQTIRTAGQARERLRPLADVIQYIQEATLP